MDSIKTLNGDIIGYSLPSNIAALQKNIVRVQDFSGRDSFNLLPPIPELLNIKELIAIHTFSDELIGFSLPPEIKKIQDVLVQLKAALNIDDAASEDAFNSLLINIKNLEQIEDEQTRSFKDALDSLWLAIYQIYQNNQKAISVLMPIFIFLSGYAAEKGLDYIFDDHQQEQMIEMIEQQQEELKELKEQNNVILDEIKSLKSQASEEKDDKQPAKVTSMDVI
jgi:hypothetical protein|nr:MAG TPA: hypothetical protein [Caudoviricetes sp.]DAW57171.1 MAG TPA: hypothetical protein [Caudoviricetes sp.]